ncbi:ammecr1 protein [Hyaloraphidium curvatum]|nr:ammecr1 protein [Hyaloraphidium curvatum]
MVAYTFDNLVRHLEGGKRKPIEPDFPDDQYPLFVTWHSVASGSPRLRGCIGNFDAQPLHSGLAEYSLTSALRDRRFSPIAAHEVPHLTCAVSLLTDFESGTDYMDWEVGLHGIWIEFTDDMWRKRTATYLPEVVEEQGWSKLEAIDSLLRKGGYAGKITDKTRSGIKLTRYQSKKLEITYKEYLEQLQNIERKLLPN